ncbi:unnamed protein product [Gadus morhua 'NCC']
MTARCESSRFRSESSRSLSGGQDIPKASAHCEANTASTFDSQTSKNWRTLKTSKIWRPRKTSKNSIHQKVCGTSSRPQKGPGVQENVLKWTQPYGEKIT